MRGEGVQGSPCWGMGVSPILIMKGVQEPSPAGGLGVSPSFPFPIICSLSKGNEYEDRELGYHLSVSGKLTSGH